MRQSLTSERECQKKAAQKLRECNLVHSEAGRMLLRLSPKTIIDSLEVLEDPNNFGWR